MAVHVTCASTYLSAETAMSFDNAIDIVWIATKPTSSFHSTGVELIDVESLLRNSREPATHTSNRRTMGNALRRTRVIQGKPGSATARYLGQRTSVTR